MEDTGNNADIILSTLNNENMSPDEFWDARKYIIGQWNGADMQFFKQRHLKISYAKNPGPPILYSPTTGEKTLYISSSDVAEVRNELRRREKNTDAHYIPSTSKRLLWNAFYAVLGDGPGTVDWDDVREECLGTDLSSSEFGTPEALRATLEQPNSIATMLYWADSVFSSKEANVMREAHPKLAEAYDAYSKLIADQIRPLERPEIIDHAIEIIDSNVPDAITGNTSIFFHASDGLEAKALAAALVFANNHKRSFTGKLDAKYNLEAMMEKHGYSYNPATKQTRLTLFGNKIGENYEYDDRTEMRRALVGIKNHLQFSALAKDGYSTERLVFESYSSHFPFESIKEGTDRHYYPMYGRLLQFIGAHHGLKARYSVAALPPHLANEDNLPDFARVPYISITHIPGEDAPRRLPFSYKPKASLPDEQKRFFNALNDVIQCTGAHAGHFDFEMVAAMYRFLKVDTLATQNKVEEYFHQKLGTEVKMPPPNIFPFLLNLELKKTSTDQSDADLRDEIQADLSSGVVQVDTVRQMHGFMTRRIPGLENFDMVHSMPYCSGVQQEFLDHLKQVLGDAAIKEYRGESLLLDNFAEGKKDLGDLLLARPVTNVDDKFEITHPTLGVFLMEAIEASMAALRTRRPLDNAKLDAAMDELRSAYEDLVKNVEEKRRTQREQQRLKNEAVEESGRQKTRELEEAMLKSAAYASMPSVDNTAYPEDLRYVQSEVISLAKALNNNFTPDKNLGDALFQNDKTSIGPILNAICGNHSVAVDEASRAELHRRAVSFLSQPIDELAPKLKTTEFQQKWLDNNRQPHEKLLQTMAHSPYLLIAMLGTQQMISEAADAQKLLLPDKKKKEERPSEENIAMSRAAIWELAEQAVQHAFAAQQKPIPDFLSQKITAARAQAESAQETASIQAVQKQEADRLEQQQAKQADADKRAAERAAADAKRRKDADDAAKERARLVEEQVAAAATAALAEKLAPSSVSSEPPVPPPVENPPVAALPEPPAQKTPPIRTAGDLADDIYKRLNTCTDKYLSSAPPYNKIRCTLEGRKLKILFSRDTNGHGNGGGNGKQPKVFTALLDVLDGETALNFTMEIQDYLLRHGFTAHKHQTIAREYYTINRKDSLSDYRLVAHNGNTEEWRIIQYGDMEMVRLCFQHNGDEKYTQVDIPLGLDHKTDDATAQEVDRRRKLVVDYVKGWIALGHSFTPENVITRLKLQVARDHKDWADGKKITNADLVDSHIDTWEDTAFPNETDRTCIQVGTLTSQGTPNAYWQIPLRFYPMAYNEKGKPETTDSPFCEISVNTHMRDEEDAKLCVPEVLEHFRKALEQHKRDHSNSHWALDGNGGLYEDDASVGNNIDLGTLNVIRAKLPYLGEHNVTGVVRDDGTFEISLERPSEDGFLVERTHKPLKWNGTINTAITPDEKQAKVEAFCARVNEIFKEKLNAYFVSRKAHPQTPATIEKRCRESVAAALQEEPFSDLAIDTRKQSGGGAGKVSGEHRHHRDGDDGLPGGGQSWIQRLPRGIGGKFSEL